MPRQQEGVDVVRRVLHAVLVQRQSAPGQAHGGQAIVLGHHHVAGAQQVHQGKVHAVRPLGEHQRLRALPLKAVGGIAED